MSEIEALVGCVERIVRIRGQLLGNRDGCPSHSPTEQLRRDLAEEVVLRDTSARQLAEQMGLLGNPLRAIQERLSGPLAARLRRVVLEDRDLSRKLQHQSRRLASRRALRRRDLRRLLCA